MNWFDRISTGVMIKEDYEKYLVNESYQYQNVLQEYIFDKTIVKIVIEKYSIVLEAFAYNESRIIKEKLCIISIRFSDTMFHKKLEILLENMERFKNWK